MKKIAQRFCDVWKLDFLSQFFIKGHKDNKTTVLFWIVCTGGVALVLTIVFLWYFHIFTQSLTSGIDRDIADGARITMTDGYLMMEGVDDPFFREFDVYNAHNDALHQKIAIIIDTQSVAYDITSLDEYVGGVVVLGNRLYTKDGSEINTLDFVDVENFSLTKEDVIAFIDHNAIFPIGTVIALGVFFGLVFFYGILRLIMALWWALLLFVLTKIFGMSVQYSMAYKAVLNLYIIPTFAVLILQFMGMEIVLLTTLIFVVIFIANLIWINKQIKKDPVESLEVSVDDATRKSDVHITKKS